MRSLIFDRVSFAHAGGDEILSDVSLALGDGWTGIVGENGAGKSTLLRLAAGELAPARGTIRRVHVHAVAFAEQRVDAPGEAVADLAARADRDAARWRARLGLDAAELARWPTLSPGERKRWQLAAALAGEPDLLIVDEPTNHLDADALGRCADALAAFRGIGLLVSHDRELLERLPRQIVRVHAGAARLWPGAYGAASAAWCAEAEALRDRRAHLGDTRRHVERQLADARRRERAASRATFTSARMRNRHDSDARTLGARNLASWAAAAAGRDVDRLHTRLAAARAAEDALQVERERGAAIRIDGEPAPRRWLVRLEGADVRAGDKLVAREARLAIARDDRVWLRGDNGAGKTTLLRALAGACTLPAERVLILPQDQTLEASAALTREIRGLDREARGRLGQLADALGIDPARAVGSALPSPGEARKLALAMGLVRRPWLALLDEPTNHLDLPSIERLERALAGYGGALVLITHDARLASALCTSTWTIGGGRVTAEADARVQPSSAAVRPAASARASGE
jgi:ATPase subunit of ABC transporter with duplicated ATPase domains